MIQPLPPTIYLVRRRPTDDYCCFVNSPDFCKIASIMKANDEKYCKLINTTITTHIITIIIITTATIHQPK